jgi:hypothetical protein
MSGRHNIKNPIYIVKQHSWCVRNNKCYTRYKSNMFLTEAIRVILKKVTNNGNKRNS